VNAIRRRCQAAWACSSYSARSCSIMGAPSARDAGNRMTVVCEPCGRRGRYNVERLIAKHGDAKILYLLAEITACPKTQSTNINDRCKAKYEGLTTR
jgi:hypothetical protein